MRSRPVIVAVLAACAALTAGCGNDRAPAPVNPRAAGADLVLRHNWPSARTERWRCAPVPGPGVQACDERTLRALRVALDDARKRTDEACTMLYAGPQTVVVTGAVLGKDIGKVRYTREDGCADRDFRQLMAALGRTPEGLPKQPAKLP